VVYFDEPMVSLIQTGKGGLVKNIKVGNDPVALAFTQDGSRIYIANQGSGTASVIRTSDNRVVATVKVGQSPRALGVTSIPKNAGLN